MSNLMPRVSDALRGTTDANLLPASPEADTAGGRCQTGRADSSEQRGCRQTPTLHKPAWKVPRSWRTRECGAALPAQSPGRCGHE